MTEPREHGELELPPIEVLAAFRMSHRTAVREGFPRTAARVQEFLDVLETFDRFGTWKVVVTPGPYSDLGT